MRQEPLTRAAAAPVLDVKPDRPVAPKASKTSRRGKPRGPNLRDVAAEAGVSVATVSLVLNDSARISRATCLRVRRVMQELDYQPNRLAQSLSGKYVKSIAVLVPGIRHAFADAYFGELLSGISDEADAAEQKVLIEQANDGYVAARKHVELFERRYVDGVLLLGVSDQHRFVYDLTGRELPAVVIDNVLPPEAPGGAIPDHVVSDYGRGAEQALSYLRQLGHRSVGLLRDAGGHIATARQFEAAWRGHPLNADLPADRLDALCDDGQFTERGGAAAAARLLKRNADMTALLCMNDKMAIGAMHWMDRHGVRVPGDVSVVGFDDLPHAAFVNPSLTTIHLPLYEVGRRACRRLIERVQGQAPAVAETLKTHLVVRDSTAMARRRDSA